MSTNIFKQTIIICWDEEQQVYIADAPDLPSCTGSGATYTEALDSVLEALQWWQKRTHRTRQARPPQKQDA
jgi:predicted RNase H-like HicB family nuclease